MFVKEMAFSDYHEVITWELRAAITRYFEVWTDVVWKKEEQSEINTKYVEQYRLPIIVLSCTLLECAINFYLCTKCDAKRFRKIEANKITGSLYGKWTKAPKEFVPSYHLPDDDPLARDLKVLIGRRKAIVHNKPYLSIDGDDRHKGNQPDIKANEHDMMRASATLPYRLLRNIEQHDPDSWSSMSSLITWCGTAASTFEGREGAMGVLFSTPRDLIEEIMQQGHDRETALWCALSIGEPELDETGHYVMRAWRKKYENVKIKPLKFFQNKQQAGVTDASFSP